MINYSLILVQNFSVNLQFHMWGYNITMATFCMSQCQDGSKVVFLNVMNEDVRALKDALENLNSQVSTSRRILSGILLKNSGNYKLKL